MAKRSARVAAAGEGAGKARAGLEEQRKKLRKVVPAQLLKRYEFIRQRRNGTAIAPVYEGVCFGCHMNILPQQFIDLQKGEEILQCPHCQRILYWREEEEEAEAGTALKPGPGGSWTAGPPSSGPWPRGRTWPRCGSASASAPRSSRTSSGRRPAYADLEEGILVPLLRRRLPGQPGPAGPGVVLSTPGESGARRRYLGETTNNVAEYQALILGLKRPAGPGVKKLQVYADSELLVRQINGSYRVRPPTSSPSGAKPSGTAKV